MSLHSLCEKYHDRVVFLVVYVREAHPVDGWWLGAEIAGWYLKFSGSRAVTDVYDPKTMEEQRAVAGRCEAALAYGIRTYVDEMDDEVNTAYAAMPTRLYLVGVAGRVVYAGGMGPFEFKSAEQGEPLRSILCSWAGKPSLT